MPQVIYDMTKGLYQQSGSGFVMATETKTGTNVATPGVACTLSTAAAALSLADGSETGQLKWFIASSAGDVVITPATTAGSWATCTLTNIGDSCCLMWIAGTGWAILSRGGGVAQAHNSVVTLPVIG